MTMLKVKNLQGQWESVPVIKGKDGADGQDGHSPVVTASKSEGVTTVSVDGTAIATINDGINGTNGADGHSPIVTASKSGTVTTISVDDTPIATINDGATGQDGYTPVKGTDYWTQSEVQSMTSEATQAAVQVATTNTYKQEVIEAVTDIFIVNVSGATPTITAETNTRYICGEVTSISFTPSQTGICEVMFTSGSTIPTLTLPVTVKMPNWFSLEANKIYLINIEDGIYGTVMVWDA